MKCNWSNVSLGWRSGSIDSMTKEAIDIAKLLDTKVDFKFNDVTVNVSKHSDWEDVAFKALDAVKSGKTSVYGKEFSYEENLYRSSKTCITKGC